MSVPRPTIAAILIHVPRWREGFAWYKKAFPTAAEVDFPELKWRCLQLDGISIEIVDCDAKVGSGKAGTVVYWRTEDFDSRIASLEALGSVLYRGPIEIEGGNRMCQFLDPFGNLLGIRGVADPALR